MEEIRVEIREMLLGNSGFKEIRVEIQEVLREIQVSRKFR